MKTTREECEESGGQWDKDVEVCSTDLDWETESMRQTTRVSSGIFMIAGAILIVPLYTSPLGVPLIIYGITRQLLPRESGYSVAITLAVTVIFYAVLIIGALQLVSIIPDPQSVLEAIGSAIFPSPK